MSEFDQLYREVILDHYKNPRGHGLIEDADAEAEGENPLCGDEVTIYVAFRDDGDTIDEVKFSGRGCAISQAATSMLTEMVKGRSAMQVARILVIGPTLSAIAGSEDATTGIDSRYVGRSWSGSCRCPR